MSGLAPQTVDVQAMLSQLAEAREKLREERAAIKPKLAEVQRLNGDALQTRRRTRRAAARYLQRVRAKASAESKPIADARRELALQQEELNRAFAELTAIRNRYEEEMNLQRERVKQSWDLLADQQKQFATERDNFETNQSQLFQMHEQRERDFAMRETHLKTERAAATQELSAVRAERIGVEQRVMSARLLLQDLEQKRVKQVVTATPFVPEPVSLAPANAGQSGNAYALHQHEYELGLERRALDRARTDLEKLAEHLTDQRQVLAEQFHTFAGTQLAWHRTESHTIEEIEELAKAVEQREQWLATRNSALDSSEQGCRERERELGKYRGTLDRWHTALVERETQFVEERERAESGLAARRGIVAEREVGLDMVCQKWEADHIRVREQLLEEKAKWNEDRQVCLMAIAECDRSKRTVQEQAAKLAAWLLAIEQQQQESSGKPDARKASRRVKALRKRWETRFARTLHQLDERLEKLNSESRALEVRYRDYRELSTQLDARQHQLQIAVRKHERIEVLTAKMPADAPPILLRVADARRQRTDGETAQLRAAAHSFANNLMALEADAGLVPLQLQQLSEAG